MAITILSQPGQHTPAYNNQYFVLNSGNKALTNFRYVCAIQQNSTLVATLHVTPDIDTGYGYFDPSRIAQSYVNKTFDPSVNELSTAGASITEIYCQFNEEYGDPVSGFAVSASGLYYVWNASQTAYDFNNYTFAALAANARIMSSGWNDDELLYLGNKALITQNVFVFWHRAFTTTSFNRLHILCYNTAGTLIQSCYIANTYETITTTLFARNIQWGNISRPGMQTLEAAFPGSVTKITDPAGDIIPATTSYYIFRWLDSGLNNASQYYLIRISDFCSLYDKWVVHFLNRDGAIDFFVFNKVNRTTINKKELKYKGIPFSLNSSNDYTYTDHDSNTKSYSIVITERITLNSDWITDAQATWLKELITSPYVVLENDVANQRYAVEVVNSQYEVRKKVNDKIFNLTIELEYSFEDVRQRG